jgi:Cobalt transport protein
MDLLRSLPIGLYLEQPVTWLHRLDSRVKLAWLMTFLIAPILANPVWRLMLVAMLNGAAAAILPFSILPQRDRARRTSIRTSAPHPRRRINLFPTARNPSTRSRTQTLVQTF